MMEYLRIKPISVVCDQKRKYGYCEGLPTLCWARKENEFFLRPEKLRFSWVSSKTPQLLFILQEVAAIRIRLRHASQLASGQLEVGGKLLSNTSIIYLEDRNNLGKLRLIPGIEGGVESSLS